MDRSNLKRYAWLSIAGSIATIGLKSWAYHLTGSVGLLSDAVESLVNLVAAVFALAMLTVAARPPDKDHPYGHSKAEYFAGGVEGALILLAAISIAVAAVERLIHPRPLEHTGIGLVFCALASLVNLGVALTLLRTGKLYNSITLEADAHHLLTDVWTSVGVIAGVGAVAMTGWGILDPLVALLVAANIVWTSYRLMSRSVFGLMDTALPPNEIALVETVLERYRDKGMQYHALRTQRAGARRFVSVHVLVPDSWTIQHGHQLVEEIEAEIRSLLSDATVFTHLEPIADPVSLADQELDR
jgi:cation diffusion facilitator family transporter